GRSDTSGILSALRSDSRMVAANEAALTSANAIVREAADLYAQALKALILREAETVDELFLLLLRSRTLSDELKSLVQGARNSEAVINPQAVNTLHLRPTLLAILSALKHATGFEDGMIALAKGGGSARLRCALYGGLAGALFGNLPESWIAELHVSSALDAMIKKQTLYRRETLTVEKIVDSLSKKLSGYEE
ncbi:MAG: ADP-ribosylglycohydrolase family protein, partial [Spirochaetales bacterium]|nr:ADP-ribosylglycohydrolase family protein [Spirochaetales bacterium]